MKRVMMLATCAVAVHTCLLGVLAAAEGTPQTKTGVVKKVDTSTKQVVVMVARELTFTVTESTKIVQGDEAKKLAEIKVGARVTVDYKQEGDTRTAKKIAILAGEVVGTPAPKEAALQTKTGTVKKVDTSAKQVVVMVTRELTFSVTESTKIVQGDESKTLADIRVEAKVTVEYTREGDTRTAKKIVILGRKAGVGS